MAEKMFSAKRVQVTLDGINLKVDGQRRVWRGAVCNGWFMRNQVGQIMAEVYDPMVKELRWVLLDTFMGTATYPNGRTVRLINCNG